MIKPVDTLALALGTQDLMRLGANGDSAAVVGVGVDLVHIHDIKRSIQCFGERFLRRLFTAQERASAEQLPQGLAAGLAQCFAAKEATIKALDLGQTGLSWRSIEVIRLGAQGWGLHLHGSLTQLPVLRGQTRLALALGLSGDYALARLTVLRCNS